MFRAVGIPESDLIPDYIYEMAFNEWYMVQGGIVLVLNTIQSYVSNFHFKVNANVFKKLLECY